MTSTVPEISEFLLARIADDEGVAQRNSGNAGLGDDGVFPDYRTYSDADTDAADDFLHRFNPVRVLAECEAKRRIVQLADAAASPDVDPIAEHHAGNDGPWVGSVTLKLLALPYADHPDYREEWRP